MAIPFQDERFRRPGSICRPASPLGLYASAYPPMGQREHPIRGHHQRAHPTEPRKTRAGPRRVGRPCGDVKSRGTPRNIPANKTFPE